MAYAFIAVTKLQTSTGSTCSGSVSSTAANALFCAAASFLGSGTQATLTPSGGGTWTVDTNKNNGGSNPNFFNSSVSSCPSATGGSQTITVSNGNTSGVTAFIYEFSGNVTTSIRDATSPAVATGSSTTATTGSLSNVTAAAVFVGMEASDTGANPATITGTSSGWTYPAGGKETNGATFQAMGSGYKIVSATGAETSAWTLTNSNWNALIAVYKASASTSVSTSGSAFVPMRGRVPMVGGRFALARTWGSDGGAGVGYGNRRRRVIC